MNHPMGARKLQRGAAAVEFALVLPLLLMIFAGIIEFGVMMYDQAVITNAAREGARWGVVQAAASVPSPMTGCGQVSSVQGGTCSGTQSQPSNACQVASNYSTGSLISFGASTSNNPSVSVSCNNPTGNQYTIQVQVSYNFTGFGMGLLNMLGAQTLTSTTTMYYE